ncbi:MAG: DUF393 domain-containing protein [Candidatus Omnitrophica bacterium]|nr:DUF393 domain-containing protein [Candidatus Omnitrophota bacterium]
MTKAIVLYDGNCALCIRTMKTIAFLDIFKKLYFINAWSSEAIAVIEALNIKSDDLLVDMHIVEGVRFWKGYPAYQRISLRIPLLWIFVPFLYFPPIKYIGERIYRRVADSRTCQIAPLRDKP